jgi:predicted RNA-binding Zn ribbon-like protein
MDFSHYSTRPVQLAIDLVNTRESKTDRLETLSDLDGFLDEYRELWVEVARPATDDDVEAIRTLRTALRDVFTSEDEAAAAERLNEILSAHGAEPRLSAHDGTPHLHFEPIGSSMADWLGAVTAMGLASVVVEDGVDRFGVCGASPCQDVFVDTSRNRSRLHCSSTCSTRAAVAAYRKRQSS